MKIICKLTIIASIGLVVISAYEHNALAVGGWFCALLGQIMEVTKPCSD